MDFSKIRNYLFLGLLAAVTLTFFYVLRPFAYPIFWAAVLAALFYPFFARLNKFLKHPNLSATITLVAVAVIIILPLTIIGLLLVREAVTLYGNSRSTSGNVGHTLQSIMIAIKHNPLTAGLKINESLWAQKFSEIGQSAVNYIFSALKDLTQNSLTFLAMFILMLYTLFFFIRDGGKILKKLMYLLPLGDRYEIMLYNKFTAAATATIKGTLIMGVVQGTIGGIIFWVAGINGVLIWSVVMAVCSLIPGIGTALIWLPAGVILLLSGQVWQGIFILFVGTLVISTVDNLLRPIIVGKNLQMPALLILLSTLGGIAVFGFSGFMIGPIIVALFISFWEMYEEYYRTELQKN